jgi:hypothetical protein
MISDAMNRQYRAAAYNGSVDRIFLGALRNPNAQAENSTTLRIEL